jgi:D-beta-D-heptose 7-phosphate kinase/D-beta-D-heptose 1-phosphate adenosyltransferase
VVFTNGCFDILHIGHVRLLEQAAKLGEVLFVAVNSDRSVRKLKGPSRPVKPQGERAEILAALASVDFVVIFDELTPLNVIKAMLPDVLVKGGDWTRETIVGRKEVENAGGKVVVIPLTESYSTSRLIERIGKLVVA